MYLSEHSFSTRLLPDRYTGERAFAEESEVLRCGGWHLVAVESQLERPGSYVATTVLGVPLLVRNCDGVLAAFRNVCAHRHCRLHDEGMGVGEEFKCPYHGWRYGADGRTRKLPGAKNFPGFDRETHRLEVFEVACCGRLVFVKLDSRVPPLNVWASRFLDLLQVSTDSTQWHFCRSDQIDFEANWKIPVEISLESYHLSEVHSATFGSDPGEEASRHGIHPESTEFASRVRMERRMTRLEAWAVTKMTGDFAGTYRQFHLYPNFFASFTDTVTVVFQVEPTGAETCRMHRLIFIRRATRPGPAASVLSAIVRRTALKMIMKIQDEDAAIFPRVQQGKRGAVDAGILGRCEERIDAFHAYLETRTVELKSGVAGAAVGSDGHSIVPNRPVY